MDLSGALQSIGLLLMCIVLPSAIALYLAAPSRSEAEFQATSGGGN